MVPTGKPSAPVPVFCWSLMAVTELGPAEPFYKPKLNCCRMCGSVTVNRYNCTLCLDKIQENIDDNFILFTSGSTSDVESPDWGGTIDA